MKKIAFILFILISVSANSNPVVRGTWLGYIMNGGDDLYTTLYVTDDNNMGAISGEILITYSYKYDKKYYCKARFSGNIDYKTYELIIVMEEYIFYDLLPEGKKWCLGTFYGMIQREMETRQYLILASMSTKCTDAISKVVLVKQQ